MREFASRPWPGRFAVDGLADTGEEAVSKEFEAISERGGVLGAMDAMYQRGKIQKGSVYYEHKKHDGSLPLVGVNMFLPKEHAGKIATEIELIRLTEEEKGQQIENVLAWQQGRNALAPKATPHTRIRRTRTSRRRRSTTGMGWRICRTRRVSGAMCSER